MSGSREGSPASAEAGALVIEIGALTDCERDVSAVDEIARASFTELGFSARKELERPWARIWVARETHADSQAEPDDAGEIAAPPERRSPMAFLIAWHVADELHILNVATAPFMRKRGIGTALMGEALRFAAKHHVRLVLLEVRRSNMEARRLYRRLGFADTNLRPGYYADNGEDAVEMALSLDPETGLVLPAKDDARFDL